MLGNIEDFPLLCWLLFLEPAELAKLNSEKIIQIRPRLGWETVEPHMYSCEWIKNKHP